MAGSRAPGSPEGVVAQPFPTGTLLDGKFRVAGVLGQGAAGVVYEIVHEETRKRRALRVLPVDPAADEALADAALAGKLRHRHLVEVFETGRLADGHPYILMDLLEGVSLAQRIQETGGLGLEEVGEVLGQACEGLQAAHDAGILHRGLRPEKVFVTSGAGRPLVKLLDFGLGRLPARDAPSGREYAAPEQRRDASAADARSDVHALGVILYEAVAGTHPGPASEAQPLEKLRPKLPFSLGELAAAAMNGDPARRPPTARALGDALRVIVRDASVDPLGKTLPVTDGVLLPLPFEPPPRARISDPVPAAEAETTAQRAARGESAPAQALGARRPTRPMVRLVAVVLLAVLAAVATALLLRGFGRERGEHKKGEGDSGPSPGRAAPSARR